MERAFELLHPAGVAISRGLTQAKLMDSFKGQDLPHQDMGTGWVWIRLPPFPDGELVVAISLGFNRGTLEQISLSDANPKYGTSWDDWSEKQEQLRANAMGRWLTDRGYAAGSYSWGSVWAAYDAKSGSGSAGVRYAI